MPSICLLLDDMRQVVRVDGVDDVGKEGAGWRAFDRSIVSEVLLEGGVIESHVQKHLDTDLTPARKLDPSDLLQFECKLVASEQLLNELPVDDAVGVCVKLLYNGQ